MYHYGKSPQPFMARAVGERTVSSGSLTLTLRPCDGQIFENA